MVNAITKLQVHLQHSLAGNVQNPKNVMDEQIDKWSNGLMIYMDGQISKVSWGQKGDHGTKAEKSDSCA